MVLLVNIVRFINNSEYRVMNRITRINSENSVVTGKLIKYPEDTVFNKSDLLASKRIVINRVFSNHRKDSDINERLIGYLEYSDPYNDKYINLSTTKQ